MFREQHLHELKMSTHSTQSTSLGIYQVGERGHVNMHLYFFIVTGKHSLHETPREDLTPPKTIQ